MLSGEIENQVMVSFGPVLVFSPSESKLLRMLAMGSEESLPKALKTSRSPGKISPPCCWWPVATLM